MYGKVLLVILQNEPYNFVLVYLAITFATISLFSAISEYFKRLVRAKSHQITL